MSGHIDQPAGIDGVDAYPDKNCPADAALDVSGSNPNTGDIASPAESVHASVDPETEDQHGEQPDQPPPHADRADGGDDGAVHGEARLANTEPASKHAVPDADSVDSAGDGADRVPRPVKRLIVIWYPGEVANIRTRIFGELLRLGVPIYVHGNVPVLVGTTGALGDAAATSIQVLTAPVLALIFSALFEFQHAETKKPIAVPNTLVRACLSGPTWPLPLLRRLVTIPTMLPDGRVLVRPGFDAATGFLYAPETGLIVPDIPEHPSLADAQTALMLLIELFCDALFADPVADLAAMLAAVITPIVRPGIKGCVPAFVIAAASSRIGKTELVQFVALILTGLRAKLQVPRSDEETEKRITAHVKAGDPLIVFDNGARPIGGEAIESALTTETWTGRLLRTNDFFTGPMLATVFFTGNRVSFHIDMLGRVVVVNLATELENLSARSLKRENPQQWILANRPVLIAAALIICRAYQVAGAPDMRLPPMRGFDQWSKVVRSALVWAGTADPLQGLAEMKSSADIESEAFAIALKQLEALFPRESHFIARTVFDALQRLPGAGAPGADVDALQDALKVIFDADPVKLGPLRFGHKFAKLADRTVGGRHMKSVRRSNVGKEYKVFRPTPPPGRAEPL